jgi:hypothetical protein
MRIVKKKRKNLSSARPRPTADKGSFEIPQCSRSPPVLPSASKHGRKLLVKRRDFMTLLSGTAAWPLAAHAQRTKVHRIGALLLGNADADSFRAEMRGELRKSGYVEGPDLHFDFRSVEGGLDLLPKMAAELVTLRVDVIVAVYTPCALAAQQATHDIPIIVVSGDPVASDTLRKRRHPGMAAQYQFQT